VIPQGWVDDGTTWDTRDVVVSDGPATVYLEPEDLERLDSMPEARPVVGFTNAPVKPTYSPRHRK